MELVNYSTSFWSVLPAALALALAIITRRVLLSLSVGIVVGAFMLVGGNPLNALSHLGSMFVSLVYDSAEQSVTLGKLQIVLFLLLLGIFTALLTVSGSNQAFAQWARQHIKGRRGAKLLTASLVFVTFIDDYFHSLAVGAIARPVTDKFQVSRAKLAYILDSTAAPMCVLMPVSSWGASIIATVGGLLATYQIADLTPMGAFISMSMMNFYAIFALLFVFFVAYFSFDFGTMAKLERQAQKQACHEAEEEEAKGRVFALIVPILVLIVSTVLAMLSSGGLFEHGELLKAFENTNVNQSLVIGGSAGVLAVVVCTFGLIPANAYPKAIWAGMKSMFGAIEILVLAWLISFIVKDMHTGDYLSTLVAGNINPAFLPVILFALSALMAFATGTSWGTFGIMLPIAAGMAIKISPELLIPCMSAVMAGAVCGDHCSPISDTTILSSTGAQCNHMDHVTSQLPYAMSVALAAAVGYVVLGFSASLMAGFVATALTLGLIIFIFQQRRIVINAM